MQGSFQPHVDSKRDRLHRHHHPLGPPHEHSHHYNDYYGPADCMSVPPDCHTLQLCLPDHYSSKLHDHINAQHYQHCGEERYQYRDSERYQYLDPRYHHLRYSDIRRGYLHRPFHRDPGLRILELLECGC